MSTLRYQSFLYCRFILMAILIVVALYFVILTFTPLEKEIIQSEAAAIQIRSGGVAADSEKNEIGAINLFGTYQKESEVALSFQDYERVSLPDLNAIVSNSQQSRLGSLILTREGIGEVFHVGDYVSENLKIFKISNDGVLVKSPDGYKILELADFSDHKPGSVQISATRSQNDNEGEEEGDLSSRSNVISMLGLVPVSKGSPMGYKVTEDSEKLIDEYRLKPGDVVLSVNGYPLGTEHDDELAYSSYKKNGSGEFLIRRGGATIKIIHP